MKIHDYLDDEAKDRAALYAMRALPAAEATDFETHIAACAACRVEAEEIARVTSELAGLGRSVRPPARLRQRVLDRFRAETAGAPRPLPGLAVIPADEGAWMQTPIAGVEVRVLYLDQATGRTTQLMRMAPGSSFPKHRHSGHEECYVLQGSMRSGDVVLRVGDYQRAEPESVHGITSEEGCLMLVTGSVLDEILEEATA